MRALVTAVAIVAAFIVTASAARAAQAPAGAAAITVVKQTRLDKRLLEYKLRTPALAGDTNVRVLLPDGYDESGYRRYPVLYLLHGCCDFDVDGSQAWTTHGEAEQSTAGLPLIIVMPASGRGGFYTDWYNGGKGGAPQYETYHVGELIPWIDSRFRTLATRRGRAVAGLSMGGFGAMSYAARHPDMFVFAAAFSGAVDLGDPLFGPVDDSLGGLDGASPGQVFGSRLTDMIRSRAHNPVDLAANLRGLVLQLRTGNGLPGGDFGGGPDPVELGVHRQMSTLDHTLTSDGMPHVWDDYGPGAHSWPYWARDLKRSLPQMMRTLAHPPAAPEAVTFTAVEPRYEAYGWRVSMNRPQLEFSTLSHATRRGFELAGSGEGTVTTPPLYRPGRRIRAAITGPGGSRTQLLRTDSTGRLTVSVSLGAANAMQQDAPGATTVVRHARVVLSAVARRRVSR